MNSQTLGLRVAAIIFALVSLAQLARLLSRVEITVAGHALPLWPNAVAFIVAVGLSWWMFKLSRRGEK
jgi:hypothetical protein